MTRHVVKSHILQIWQDGPVLTRGAVVPPEITGAELAALVQRGAVVEVAPPPQPPTSGHVVAWPSVLVDDPMDPILYQGQMIKPSVSAAKIAQLLELGAIEELTPTSTQPDVDYPQLVGYGRAEWPEVPAEDFL